jgi:hypothetical protein
VSEYQCYEFVALDRPLTSKQMVELRGIFRRSTSLIVGRPMLVDVDSWAMAIRRAVRSTPASPATA